MLRTWIYMVRKVDDLRYLASAHVGGGTSPYAGTSNMNW